MEAASIRDNLSSKTMSSSESPTADTMMMTIKLLDRNVDINIRVTKYVYIKLKAGTKSFMQE